jgi:galactonate dehydratase
VSRDQENIIVECVKRVREAVGDGAHLLLDAHGRFNCPTAQRIARRLEEYRPFFLEEPIPPENIDAMAELRRSTRVPIATGERLIGRHQFRDLLTKHGADYVQPDVVHCGGITEMRKIAALAETFYVPIVPHNPCGPVATAAATGLAARPSPHGDRRPVHDDGRGSSRSRRRCRLRLKTCGNTRDRGRSHESQPSSKALMS